MNIYLDDLLYLIWIPLPTQFLFVVSVMNEEAPLSSARHRDRRPLPPLLSLHQTPIMSAQLNSSLGHVSP